MNKSNIAIKILEHPDKDEIISKLLSGTPVADIHEWLTSKYINEGEDKFVLSQKVISTFKKDYLDMYNAIRDDLTKTKTSQLSPETQLGLEVQGSPTYRKTLEKYLDSELDIKILAKRSLAAMESRIEQIFDLIQEDPRNIKIDRTLIEWFNTFNALMEKYDTIQNGSLENINIQNNINIQVLDEHINVVYKIIKDILSKLDYDTSLVFIDMFNEEMQKIKPQEKESLPLDVRLTEVKLMNETVLDKLEK